MRFASRSVFALAGGGLIAAVVTDRGALFVRPWFLPVMLVAGVILVLASWATTHQLSASAASCLLLPLLVGVMIAPSRAADVFAADLTPSAELRPRLGEGDNPLLQGASQVTILDIALAEREVGRVLLVGRDVSVVGLVDDSDHISRPVMVCCAADARPVRLAVRGELGPPASWVRVSGKLAIRGGDLVLEPADIRQVPAPDRPFL